MTADVYAKDDGLRHGVPLSQPAGAATFDIIADADADLLGRVGAVMNLFNVAPRVFQMQAAQEGLATVTVLVDCAESQAELVARKLMQLTSVRDVAMKYVLTRSGENGRLPHPPTVPPHR